MAETETHSEEGEENEGGGDMAQAHDVIEATHDEGGNGQDAIETESEAVKKEKDDLGGKIDRQRNI